MMPSGSEEHTRDEGSPARQAAEEPTPPVERTFEEDEYAEAPQTKWPKRLGVISLIYAILGLLCTAGITAAIIAMPYLPEMMRGGTELPPIIRAVSIVQMLLNFGIGIVMLVGAVNLLRRRASGVRLLKVWAIVRVMLIVLAVVVAVLTGPAQVQMARQRLEFTNRMYEERGLTDRMKEKTDQELWRGVMLQTGISAGVVGLYPLFLGLYLSRRRIGDEVEQWA